MPLWFRFGDTLVTLLNFQGDTLGETSPKQSPKWHLVFWFFLDFWPKWLMLQMQNTTLKHSRNVTFPQPWNTLGTSTLESIKNMSLTAHGLGKPPAKASNSSKIRARSMQNTSLKNSRNVTFGIHKKHVSNGTWPWKTACESLEQQRNACPKHAKHKPEKLSERHLWNP